MARLTGDGDIGCEGHKNQLGQKRVADFLEPRMREIMGWSHNEQETDSMMIEPTSTVSRHQNLRRIIP